MQIGREKKQDRPDRLDRRDSEEPSASLRRRWGVPAGVAAGVVGVSVAAVAAFGGAGDTKQEVGEPAGNPSRPATSPSAKAGTDSPSADEKSASYAFTITGARTTPIDKATTARILASCLGADAAQFRAVIAERAPLAAKTSDGLVVAVNSAGQYAQCGTKGDTGSSQAHPPTFINDRLWGTGRIISYFDSTMETDGAGHFLMVGAGHYTSDVAKVTISFGDKKKEYPAVMADGAFAYAAAVTPDTPPGPHYAGPNANVHAYDAAGKEIYSQKKDPQFTDGQ
ncbi:hypothetical protein [Streptomyces sp. NPDC052225]|uniref:hypothetical protein n=1 Tax=Streptomyces sp. NPDC052225 TaxID=3154949 RepID=UPI00341EF841